MVTVEGDGNCFPRALAIACQPTRIRGVTRRFATQPAITSSSAGLAWAGLGWPYLTNEGAAKRRDHQVLHRQRVARDGLYLGLLPHTQDKRNPRDAGLAQGGEWS